jgi:hypothetical protein
MENEKESSRKERKKANKSQMDKETGKVKTFQLTTVQIKQLQHYTNNY